MTGLTKTFAKKVNQLKDNILIIGASGAVGSAIVRMLAVQHKYNLILAGRRLAPLRHLKESLVADAAILKLDVARFNDAGILKAADLVIMCVDIPDSGIPKACAEQGIKYMDISASQQVLRYLEQTDAVARANKVPLLFSVGLAPGLTNLLAKNALDKLPGATAVEIYILLGLGEVHGDQAFQWTFKNLHKVYPIHLDGLEQPVKSFTAPKTTVLLGKRKFYLFDFVDQHILKTVRGLRSVSTRLAFDNRFFTALIGFLRRIGWTKICRNKRVQTVMMRLLKKARLGSDIYGIKVVARDDKGQTATATLNGHNEGAITAAVAAGMVPLLLATHASGLLHSPDLVQDLPAFLTQLKQDGSPFNFSLANNIE